ncbi:uncharacterized protein LOC116217086 [Meleagris gallopavo]|uniref:uncharacterized protein LOC116217086 n=1 Tax=Meleagris gallopavo TaxID=9103 RepID=UPI0012ABD9BC|nr:uncharacterized protein LOC116217086 [Meleagris gallopavo]
MVVKKQKGRGATTGHGKRAPSPSPRPGAREDSTASESCRQPGHQDRRGNASPGQWHGTALRPQALPGPTTLLYWTAVGLKGGERGSAAPGAAKPGESRRTDRLPPCLAPSACDASEKLRQRRKTSNLENN